MKSNDLRIGNLIDTHCIGKETPYKIGVLDFANKTCERWTGIPLTKEWLLKLGAKKTQICGYWISVANLKAELHFETFDNTDEIVTTLISQSCELILDRIRFVHQLQNLYFCLTGEELTIPV